MSSHRFGSKLLLFLLMIPVLLFIFLPVLWLFSASLSNQVELFTVPPHWIPQHPTLQNYADIFFPSQAASGSVKILCSGSRSCLLPGNG